MLMTVQVIDMTLLGLWMAFVFVSSLIRARRSKGLLDSDKQLLLWRVLKWPALYHGLFNIAQPFLEGRALNPIDVIAVAIALWVWWSERNTGDDDRKKKGEGSLLARVKDVGGRLRVVPLKA